jgi:Nickel responsive protein SCO4226-like
MVFVVERYLPGLSRSDLLHGLSRLERDATSERRAVRYLGSTIVLGDEACFCQFEGPSEAAVAEANRRAGLSFDRIVPPLHATRTQYPDAAELAETRVFG